MPKKILLLAALLLAAGPLAAAPPAQAQHIADMLIGSTADRGGALTLHYDFAQRVHVTRSLSAGGVSFYTTVDPGFDVVSSPDPLRPIYPLRNNISVSLQIVALDPGVSLKVRNTTLTAAGESAVIGSSPNLHEHPQWRLTVGDDVFGEFRLSFRLTTTSASYQGSTTYTAWITNLATDPSPTATPTRTASPSPPPSASPSVTPTRTLPQTTATVTATAPPTATATTPETASTTATATSTVTAVAAANIDANCDRRMSAADIVAVTRSLAGLPSSCSADADGDGRVDEADRWRVLHTLFDIAKYPI